MLKRYLLVVLTAAMALCVSMVNGMLAQSNNWNASTEVVNILIVDDPRRVLRSTAEHSLDEELTAWLEMAHRPAYMIVANTGPGRVIKIPDGEWDESDKVDLAVETINAAARSPTTSQKYLNRVNGIRRKHLRKAAGQLDLRFSVWGRQSFFAPQAKPVAKRPNTQLAASGKVRPRPLAYTPPLWETVLGWWLCFVLLFGCVGGGLVVAYRVVARVRRWKATPGDTSVSPESLHDESPLEEAGKRGDGAPPADWTFTPESRRSHDGSSSSNKTSRKTMSRKFRRFTRRFTQNGLALIGVVLVLAQLLTPSAHAKTSGASFTSAHELQIAASLPGRGVRFTSVRDGGNVNRIFVFDVSGSIYDQSIKEAQDRLTEWADEGFRTRVYALGDRLVKVGDVPPGASASEVRTLLEGVEPTQHTRLAESLISLHHRIQSLLDNGAQNGERPLVLIASDFDEDTEYLGMEALSFGTPDSSDAARGKRAATDTLRRAQMGDEWSPWWWAITGAGAGVVVSSLIWGVAWRRRMHGAEGDPDRVQVIVPTEDGKEVRSARSLQRQPIKEKMSLSGVEVEVSTGGRDTISVVLLSDEAATDGEVTRTEDDGPGPNPSRNRPRGANVSFSWDVPS